jgi:hypothetical protein
MSILQRFMQVQEMQRKNRQLEKQIKNYQHVQELLTKDILTLRETESTVKGNDYQQYATAVQAISNKYNNAADWGCMQTGIIIDLRAAFILGEGVQIIPTTKTKDEAQREMQWANDFLDYNDLDAEMAQEIAKEAEIEGKIALKLYYDKEEFKGWPGMVSVRYISWLTKHYEVETDPQDYLWYKKLKWMPTSKDKAEELGEDEFVYKKFGGRLNKPNEAQPKIMRALTAIDKLDKALWDLRRINHLFASPTPNFEVDDPRKVNAILEYLKDINWKFGKALVHTAKFSMVGPDSAGVANLVEEITTWAKIVSGITGVPIHYLGFLDLLKNRATGENTRELIMAVTEKERKIWIGAYEELLIKAMKMFNEKANAQKSKERQLDPYRIKVTIPHITQEHWDRIEKVLIPAAVGGIVSKEYVASQIPGVDMQEEADRKTKRDADEAARAKEEFEALKAQMDAGQIGGI